MRTVVNWWRATVASVLVVNRFRVPEDEAEAFRGGPRRGAARCWPQQRGYVDGPGRAQRRRPDALGAGHPWENVGAYRRALSSYDVKLHAVPLLGRAIDEPSAFEVVEPGTDLNVRARPRSLG